MWSFLLYANEKNFLLVERFINFIPSNYIK